MELVEAWAGIIANFLTVTSIAVGGVFALLQWQRTIKQSKAEFVERLLFMTQEETDIKDFITLNDYDETWYTADFHADSEHKIAKFADRTFFFMNYLCFIVDSGLLTKRERALFDYYLSSVAGNKGTQAYMFDLYQYTVLNNRKFPFENYLTYCIKEGFLPKEVKDKDYFKNILIDESSNKDIELERKAIYDSLYKEYGNNMYIRSCRRCDYCCNYEEDKCLKKEELKDHEYVLYNNKCNSFVFNNKKWQ